MDYFESIDDCSEQTRTIAARREALRCDLADCIQKLRSDEHVLINRTIQVLGRRRPGLARAWKSIRRRRGHLHDFAVRLAKIDQDTLRRIELDRRGAGGSPTTGAVHPSGPMRR